VDWFFSIFHATFIAVNGKVNFLYNGFLNVFVDHDLSHVEYNRPKIINVDCLGVFQRQSGFALDFTSIAADIPDDAILSSSLKATSAGRNSNQTLLPNS
jgi:hypothetical protein